MDIIQLRTVVSIAELGSLKRASERLNIVPPALSRQIKLLEAELGVRLFRRHGRGMVVTEHGEDVVTHALKVIDEIEAINKIGRKSTSSLNETVAIGLPSSIFSLVAAPLLKLVEKNYPDLRLKLSSDFSGPSIEWLARGEVDIAITSDPRPKSGFVVRPIIEEELQLVAASRAMLSGKSCISFADAAKHDLILPGLRHGIRRRIEECAARADVTIRPKLEADSLYSVTNLVLQGLGVSIIPVNSFRDLIENETLYTCRILDPTPSRVIVMVLPSGRLGKATKITADAILNVVQVLIENGSWRGNPVSIEG